jgi:hypothetical protein
MDKLLRKHEPKPQENAVSSYLVPPPPRRSYVGYWIAGVASVAVAGLVAFGAVKLAAPAKFVYGLATGNPSLPGCRTTVASEATVGPLWYRVVNLGCGKESMHLVYVKRGQGPGWLVLPALMSVGDPVPLSVRPTGADAFEVVLSKPLADGRTAVPVAFGSNGLVKEMQSFDHGRQKDSIPLAHG